MFLSKAKYKRIVKPSPVVSLSIHIMRILIIIAMVTVIYNVESKIITAFAHIPIVMVMVNIILEVVPNKISKKDLKQLLKDGQVIDGVIDKCEYIGFRGVTHFVHYYFEDSDGTKHGKQCVIPKKIFNRESMAQGGKVKVIYLTDRPEINALIEEEFVDSILSARK